MLTEVSSGDQETEVVPVLFGSLDVLLPHGVRDPEALAEIVDHTGVESNALSTNPANELFSEECISNEHRPSEDTSGELLGDGFFLVFLERLFGALLDLRRADRRKGVGEGLGHRFHHVTAVELHGVLRSAVGQVFKSAGRRDPPGSSVKHHGSTAAAALDGLGSWGVWSEEGLHLGLATRAIALEDLGVVKLEVLNDSSGDARAHKSGGWDAQLGRRHNAGRSAEDEGQEQPRADRHGLRDESEGSVHLHHLLDVATELVRGIGKSAHEVFALQADIHTQAAHLLREQLELIRRELLGSLQVKKHCRHVLALARFPDLLLEPFVFIIGHDRFTPVVRKRGLHELDLVTPEGREPGSLPAKFAFDAIEFFVGELVLPTVVIVPQGINVQDLQLGHRALFDIHEIARGQAFLGGNGGLSGHRAGLVHGVHLDFARLSRIVLGPATQAGAHGRKGRVHTMLKHNSRGRLGHRGRPEVTAFPGNR
mmetsp:Transcript_20006/g.40422  ORF Transcript_20006/g.40422 Transcript_20006/m.40422 type:complete len:482 (-) Transcript_20006:139-1584(-)